MKSDLIFRGPLGRWLGAMCFLAIQWSVSLQASTHSFEWYYGGNKHSLELSVQEELYRHYAVKPRTWDYPNYVSEDYGYSFVPKLADVLAEMAENRGYSPWERINFVLAFVQSLTYIKDEGGEYPRYPVETIVDEGGDCEDTAILLGAILTYWNYDCVLLSPPGHMALGLSIEGYKGKHYPYRGKRYYYMETTGSNWLVGQIPDQYSGTATVYEFPGSEQYRKTFAYGQKPATPTPATEPEGELYVAFYRSHHSLTGNHSNSRASYKYAIKLEGSPGRMEDIAAVYYQRQHHTFREYQEKTWIKRTSLYDGFKSEWTGWGHAPILVRIEYKDGKSREYRIEEAPTLAQEW